MFLCKLLGERTYSFQLDIYLGVELLGYRVCPSLADIAK